MIDKKSMKVDSILYCLIFVAFYLLNRFSLFITDDFYYAFIMQEGFPYNESFIPIQTLPDILESQYYAYFHHNGRFLVHCIVQLFCGILGMNLFTIFNSLIFVLLVAGIVKCIRFNNNSYYHFDVILVTLLLFLAIPAFGKTYLGNISFAVNYLWTSCAIIWWFYLYTSRKKCNIITNVSLLLFSIAAGAMQESFSIGVAGALCIYYLFNIKELKGSTAYLVLGFLLGACFVIFAPANFVRFESDPASSYTIKQKFLQIVRVALPLRMFWLMVLCIFFISLRQKMIKKIFLGKRTVMIMIIACTINVAFAAFIAMTGKHQLVGVELFSTIVLLFMLDNYREFLNANEIKLLIISTIAFIVLYIPIYNCRHTYHTSYRRLWEKAKSSKDGIVEEAEYVKLCMGYPGWITERYAIRSQASCEFNKRGLSILLSNGKDASLIKLILPDSQANIVNACIETNLVNNCVYKAEESEYYIVRLDSEDIDKTKVMIYLQPGFMGKLIYKYVHRDIQVPDVEYMISKNQTFAQDGYFYYVVSESSPIKTVAVH